jgi:hypothetical protein
MSTKIYNGIKLNVSWQDLPAWVLRQQPAFEKMAESLLQTDLLRMAIGQFDKTWLALYQEEAQAGPDEAPKALILEPILQDRSALGLAWEIHQNAEPSQRHPACEAATIIAIPHSGEVYGLFFGGAREMQKLFSELPEVEGYSYWNNVDPDEDVSPEEWSRRGDIWEVLLGDRAPILCGSSFYLSAPRNGAEHTEAAKLFSSPVMDMLAAGGDSRAVAQAEIAFFEEKRATQNGTTAGATHPAKHISWSSKSLKTEPRFQELLAQIKSRLVDFTKVANRDLLLSSQKELRDKVRDAIALEALEATVAAGAPRAAPRI